MLLAAAAAIAACLSGGYFLADDFVQLANFAHWEATGQLAPEVARRFTGSIDGVNGFWRPFTYLTYALNHWVSGADARGWLAVNLGLHLANAMLVAALVDRLSPAPEARPCFAALLAAALFFAFASGWEAVLWIACRYDTLATFFTLLAGWWFAGGSPRKALLAAAFALMSKESGAVALVLVGFLALAREARESPLAPALAARRIVRALWPFVVLGAAYIALRIAIFGHATHAYVGVSVDLADPRHWQALARSGIEWGRATFPGPAGMRPLAGTLAVLLVAGGVVAARRTRGPLLALFALLASLATTLLLVLPYLPSFDPSGIGGRLFYLPGALLAIALGIALRAAAGAYRPGIAKAAPVLALVLLAMHLHWMWRAARDYHAAHGEMRALAAGIARIADAPRTPVALLLVPDALGRAAFGRNAQAGLMLPRVQAAPLTRRVLVQLDTEIRDIPGKIDTGLFQWLAGHSLFDLPAGAKPLPGARPMEPSAYFCWHAGLHQFVPMPPAAGSRASLSTRIEDAYVAAGCRTSPIGAEPR